MPGGRLGVGVADASEHGFGAALLMTTARALLPQRVAMTCSNGQIVSDVNRELARDVQDTGRFVTMYFMEIDPEARVIRWVRGGHDPAIFYHTAEDTFLDLGGEEMALGVVKDFEYQEYTQQIWSPGSVIVVGTDGIREAHNQEGEMFGMDRYREVIRRQTAESAETIQNAIIDALRIFQGDAPQEDDITLVVVKLL